MRGHVAGDDDDVPSARRAPYALPWVGVDDLTPTKVAMLQSLDDASRAGLVAADDAQVIERIIRDGHPYGARKRLTEAKRRTGCESDSPSTR